MTDLKEVKTERLDLSQDVVESRSVQQASEHRVDAAGLRYQRRERGLHHGAEVAIDPDRIPGGRWVHEATASGQVNRYRILGIRPRQPRLAVAAQAGTQHAAHNVHQQPDVRPGACLAACDQLALGALILARHVTEPLRGERRQPGPYLCCQGVLVPGSNEPAWLLAGDVRPTAD